MKFIFTLVFLVFIIPGLSAQPLSQFQAQQYAHALLQAEMISPEGYQEIGRIIENKPTHLYEFYQRSINPTSYFSIEVDTFLVTKSTLLGFFHLVEMMETLDNSLLMDKQKTRELTERCQKLKGRNWNVRLMDHSLNSSRSPINFNKLSSEQIQLLREDYQRMADLLHQIQLLDEKVYQDVKQWIAGDTFRNREKLGFFQFINLRTLFYEEYETTKKEQLLYLDSLRMQRVIPEENYRKLLASYQPYKLKSALDILPYCQRATVVETAQLPGESLAAFKQVLTQIQKTMLPSLSIEKVSTFEQTRKDEEYGGEYIEIILSTQLAGKEYQQTLRFDPTTFQVGSAESFSIGRVHGNEFQVVDDYLADQNEVSSLYVLDDKDRFTLSVGTRLGLILLDSLQASLLAHFDPMVAFSIPQTPNAKRLTFNREGIRKIIRTYEQLALVPALSEPEIERVIVQSRRDGFCSYQSILLSLPNLVAAIDPHLPVEELMHKPVKEVYIAILEKLSQVSRNRFVPQQPFIEKLPRKKGGSKFRFGFTMQNRLYQGILEEESELYYSFSEHKVVKLVNQALTEQKANGQYYPLLTSDQYLFLNGQQYEYLKTHQPSLFESAYKP